MTPHYFGASYITAFPVEKEDPIYTKYRLLRKNLELMRKMLKINGYNKIYWNKRIKRVNEQIEEVEETIKTLRMKGIELIKETM